MRQLLLEIGLEEVPAGFMPDTLRQLKEKAETGLAEHRLAYESLRVLGTPRRLTLEVKGLAERQSDLAEELRGPSLKVAYGEDGQPSRALEGFMRSQGIDLSALDKRDGYVYAQKTEAGKSAEAVLVEWLPELILGLHFPKMMRWGSWQTRYVRPIHWIVALLDDEVLPFALEMAASDRKSRGHRHLGEAEFAIASAQTYEEQLADNFVIVDPARRREMILTQMRDLEESVDGVIENDESLLEEVIYLVEYPQALMGGFEEAFLAMPDELIITPMKEHQRYFPVHAKKDGRLLNRFVTVRNGTADHLDIVQAGNERVLTARLSDARFFYEEDLKIDPETWVAKLSQVVFQEKLGTVLEKVERSEKLAGKIADAIGADADTRAIACRAAHLAKADLVSNVVTEFPELQGLIGEVYMAHAYDDAALAQAVREHYMPRFAGDEVPASEAGTIVALADKADTIVGCFAAGIEPTGSQDPYGLRRQAAGIVAILIRNRLTLSLRELLTLAMEGMPAGLIMDPDALMQQIYNFFRQRLRTHLREAGYPAVFTEALLNAGYDRVSALVGRSREVFDYIEQQGADFETILTVFKRAHNLAQKAEGREIDPSLFETEAEKDLYRAIRERLDAKGVREKLDAVRALREPVDRFFNDVMVMDERDGVRRNRLALLVLFTALTDDIIDLSAL